MKWKRILWAVATLIGLMVVAFLAANQLAGGGSTATVVEVARSKCVNDGFPAQVMVVKGYEIDNGILGFGGRATVNFIRDGRLGADGQIVEFAPNGQRIPIALHVELRRPMNLLEWEAASVVQGK